jgi:ADP-heptose:LPS heptosyltransferase
MVRAIAERVPVVLLNPGLTIDDHADAASAPSARIISIADRLVPERNLAAHTAVIAGARAFVGTYGGYSYLAPLCGVPAIAFYSDRAFKRHHLAAAQHIFEGLGSATVVAIDTRHADLVQLATSVAKT